MSDANGWWVAAGVLVAAEMVTGTLYLLILSLGLAAAAATAHLGGPAPAQWVVAAVVGVGSALAVWRYRARADARQPAGHRTNDSLDLGRQVLVVQWETDGTARVKHRGAQWTARLQSGTEPAQPGMHVIVGVDGNDLLLKPAQAQDQ